MGGGGGGDLVSGRPELRSTSLRKYVCMVCVGGVGRRSAWAGDGGWVGGGNT